MRQTICFIGAGNMATSLIGGLIANRYEKTAITACDVNREQLQSLQNRFGIDTSQNSAAIAESADVIVLAVKPQVMREVCQLLASIPPRSTQLFISIAAGMPAGAIDRWLGGSRAIVRCMPNTPALLQLGASGLYANARVSDEQKRLAENILDAVGISIWVEDEADLDAVTAISGSGPAYIFYFIELLESAGVQLGLEAETAGRLARQTALGAATMAVDEDVARLRAQVTSKRGTTEQAILSMQQNRLDQLVVQAAKAAHRRARDLAQELTEGRE